MGRDQPAGDLGKLCVGKCSSPFMSIQGPAGIAAEVGSIGVLIHHNPNLVPHSVLAQAFPDRPNGVFCALLTLINHERKLLQWPKSEFSSLSCLAQEYTIFAIPPQQRLGCAYGHSPPDF